MLSRFLEKFHLVSLKRKITFLIIGVASLTPIILVAFLALAYYYLGIERLFDNRVKDAVSETVKVAELYFKEHKENIKTVVLQIANDIEANIYQLQKSNKIFDVFLNKQAELRGLSEVMVFTKHNEIARNFLSFSLLFERPFEDNKDVFKKVDDGQIVILKTESKDKVRALMKLGSFKGENTYLLVGKYIDKEIINHLRKTQWSAREYHILLSGVKLTKKKLQITFLFLSGFLCIISALVARKFTKIIIKPLNQLLLATDEMKAGNYSARVQERKAQDEIVSLAKSFNRMAAKIEVQHKKLIAANNEITQRKKFIEQVLAEISAGVIVIGQKHIIALYNASALELLLLKGEDIAKQKILEIFPEIDLLIQKSIAYPSVLHQDNVTIKRKGRMIHLLISVGAVTTQDGVHDRIITFDDITELITAQRSAAWSDVAKRIAHEIKNPLTPILLATERLKKKYKDAVPKESQESFVKYLTTIKKYTISIQEIVAEFVQFSRMKSPDLEENDIVQIAKDALFIHKNTYKSIEYKIECNLTECYLELDKGQITQVFNNLLKKCS